METSNGKQKWKRFTREYKIAAVQMIYDGKPASEVARSLGIHDNLLYRWKTEYEEHGEEGFSGKGRCGRRKRRSGGCGGSWSAKSGSVKS